MPTRDFIHFKKYCKKALIEVDDNAFYRSSIRHKLIHSIRVLNFGQHIAENTPIYNQKQTQELRDIAKKALLFHDVGRFEEAVLRYQSEKNNEYVKASSLKYNHCIIGHDVLCNDSLYNDKRILFAVRYHGCMIDDAYMSDMLKNETSETLKEEMLHILFLVRDADKLENMDSIKNKDTLKKDIFYKQLTAEAKIAPPSPEVIEQLFRKEIVKYSTVYSYADRIIMVLSWFFDINYDASFNIAKEKGYKQHLLDDLANYNKDKELHQRITELFKDF